MTNKQIVAKIKKARNIAIFGHRDEDPDACGSMFAMKEFCRALGKEKVDVFLNKFEGRDLNLIFPIAETRDDFVADEFDLVVFVDQHDIGRTDERFYRELSKVDSSKILVIDHHVVVDEESYQYKNSLIETRAAACAQLVSDLFREAQVEMSSVAATYIYAGIMGDTDRFLHSNLDKKVFEDSIYLLNAGADVQFVYDGLYRRKTKRSMVTTKYFLNNIKYLEDGKIPYIIVTEKDMTKLKVGREDFKVLSGEMIKIADAKASIMCLEFSGGKYKVSLRSVECYDVGDFASKHGGGGHKNASGFEIEKTSKRKLKSMVKSWAGEILNG